MTQRLDKLKKDKVRGPNSKLVTNGPEAQNENKHSSPDKIGRLQSVSKMYLIHKAKTSLRVLKIQHPGDGFESSMDRILISILESKEN